MVTTRSSTIHSIAAAAWGASSARTAASAAGCARATDTAPSAGYMMSTLEPVPYEINETKTEMDKEKGTERPSQPETELTIYHILRRRVVDWLLKQVLRVPDPTSKSRYQMTVRK